MLACFSPMNTPTRQHKSAQFATEPVLSYAFFRSIESAGRDWDAAAPDHDLFLQRTYLAALERTPPIGMRFGYIVFYKDLSPIGVAICQIQFFKGDANISDLNTEDKTKCFFTNVSNWFKRQVAGWASADILICGNMLLSGEHGYFFDYNQIEPQQASELLYQSMQASVQQLEQEGIKVPVTLYKDIAPKDQPTVGQQLQQNGYVEFEIQPTMILDLKCFAGFDAYLSAMSTKYRTRAKRAFKKKDGIECREMSVIDIRRHNHTIYQLYQNIAQNAGFNMIQLDEDYLWTLKHELPQAFKMYGYFLNNELIAYYTTIKNHDELEAHFLGYDPKYNHDYQLYLNMLYDIIRVAFDSDCSNVMFSRTALEIKSSVGAEPHDLYCYLRHHNNMLNCLTGTVLDYLKPVEEWQPRHPFKQHELVD
jgi:hypothetical protein